MAVNGVSSNSSTDAAATAAANAARTDLKVGSNALGKDDFMKLLVAQLKNQDPNDPLDTKELVTQLSQLTSVEQLVTIGDKMATLAAATNSMAANQSSGLIGKTVQGNANTVQSSSTGVTAGAVKFPVNTESTTVSVRSASGAVVRTIDLGKQSAGAQTIKWDGKTDGGELAPQGIYTLEIAAKDKAGNPVVADQSVTGLVTGVSYESGAPELVVGTARVPLSNISSISQ